MLILFSHLIISWNFESSIYCWTTRSLALRWCFHETNAFYWLNEEKKKKKKYQWQRIVEEARKKINFLICWQSFWGRLVHFSRTLWYKIVIQLLALYSISISISIISFFPWMECRRNLEGGDGDGLSFLSRKNFDIFACEKTFAEIYYLLRMNTSFSVHKYTVSPISLLFRLLFLHLLLLKSDVWWCCCCCC